MQLFRVFATLRLFLENLLPCFIFLLQKCLDLEEKPFGFIFTDL